MAIIQARMGSSRLPGKVLMDVGGATVLERVVQRLRRADRIQEIGIATTLLPQDDKIVAACQRIGVPWHRGAEDDVLARYVGAAEQFEADVIVRITSDCPLIDGFWVDEVLPELERQAADFVFNDVPERLPRGLDVEAFTYDALRRAESLAHEHHEREHVTPVFYSRPDLFRAIRLPAACDYSHYRWTLDTPEDLQLIRAIFANFENRHDFGWQEVIALMQRSPELAAINSHIVQKPVQPAAVS